MTDTAEGRFVDHAYLANLIAEKIQLRAALKEALDGWEHSACVTDDERPPGIGTRIAELRKLAHTEQKAIVSLNNDPAEFTHGSPMDPTFVGRIKINEARTNALEVMRGEATEHSVWPLSRALASYTLNLIDIALDLRAKCTCSGTARGSSR